jgi:hypothetical protein
MKKIYIVLLCFIVIASFGQTTIRVTSGQNLQTLINANPEGTVFMVEAGVLKTDLNITKRTTIIGTGYFLNFTNSASTGEVEFNNISLNPGSDGSYITGIKCGWLDVASSNNIIQRCYISTNVHIGFNRATNLWNGTANNVMFLQNYATRLHIINQNGVGSATNFVVKGNIFTNAFHLEGNLSGEISNNTFYQSTDQTYASFQSSIGGQTCKILPIIFRNNIMMRIAQNTCQINAYPTTDFNGNVFTQNFTNLPSSNTINANPDALFLGYPNNPNNLALDARAQLSANSVAKTAGVGGTEAGAFGGDMPYVLSGIPTVPNIYQLTVPIQVPQNGTLNVQIKAKTNN